MSFTQLGQQRGGSSLTSKRAPTRRWLIACPPSIQPACHTPAISFCPTCTFLSKLPVHQQVMDSSQSPSHNGINATTQESTGGRRKKKNSIPLHCLGCSHETQKCAMREKKKRTKTFTKQANGTAYDLYKLVIFSNKMKQCSKKNSKEKILSNFKALTLFFQLML